MIGLRKYHRQRRNISLFEERSRLRREGNQKLRRDRQVPAERIVKVDMEETLEVRDMMDKFLAKDFLWSTNGRITHRCFWIPLQSHGLNRTGKTIRRASQQNELRETEAKARFG